MTCPNNPRAFLGQAAALFSQNDPAQHWVALGYIAEAECALRETDPALAEELKNHRKVFETDSAHKIPVLDAIRRIGGEPPAEKKPCIGCKQKPPLGRTVLPSVLPPVVTTAALPPDANKTPLIIFTTFHAFDRSYSLVTVVIEQIYAALLANFEVHVVCMEKANTAGLPKLAGLIVDDVFPHVHWQEDVIDQSMSDKIHVFLGDYLKRFTGPVIALTHDFVFQSWYVNVAKALHRLADEGLFPNVRWFHQLHSSVGTDRPATAAADFRARVPKGHRMVAVNYADVRYLDGYYQTTADNIVTLWNSRDLRTFGDIDPDARTVLDHTGILSVDVSQILPVSTPRAEAKGTRKVLDLFAAIKARGRSIRLVMLNAHACGQDGKKVMADLNTYARDLGISEAEFVWSSGLFPTKSNEGLGQNAVRDLFRATNVFAFPTISEACSLVVMEAALSGPLLVLNDSLAAFHEVIPQEGAMWVPWGSSKKSAPALTPGDIGNVADRVLDQLARPPWVTQRRLHQKHSIDALAARMVRLFLG